MQRIVLSEKKYALQQALLRVIARDGMEYATVRNIAAEANINPAAVSYAFTGKDELMMSLHEALQADVAQVLAQSMQGVTTLDQAIVAMAEAYFLHLLQDPDRQRAHGELTLYALARVERAGLAKSQYQGYVQQLAAAWAALAPGVVAEQIDTLARTALAMMDGVILQYLSTRDEPACRRAMQLGTALLREHAQQLTEAV